MTSRSDREAGAHLPYGRHHIDDEDIAEVTRVLGSDWLTTGPEIGNFERAQRLSPIDPMNFNNYAGIAAAYEVAQESDKALPFYRRALQERPNATWIYRNFSGCLLAAGQIDEAKQAFAVLLRSYPDLTVSKFKSAMVFSPAVLERMGESLRKLGLPD